MVDYKVHIKQLLFIGLFYNVVACADDMVTIKDTSGLSSDEVRQKATQHDLKKVKKTLHWEDLSPIPKKHDWIQTKSHEWFKGEIVSLYDNTLEFDSAEVGVVHFDFDDVVVLKSYHVMSVNIENRTAIDGILRIDHDNVTIVQGDIRYTFPKTQVVSFAPTGATERSLWSGKISLNIDFRQGNTNQRNYTIQSSARRRGANSSLSLDYLGRLTRKDDVQIANDHRISQKYDRYITRYFFWTPLFSEYYTDKYKNIQTQLTVGFGLGDTIIKSKKVEWSVSGGPAVLYTHYITVEGAQPSSEYSPALEISTHYEHELTAITDFTYNVKMTFTDTNAGKYKHHMIFSLENEIFSWMDVDITAIWDYVYAPKKDAFGITPKQDDYQLLLGFGVDF